MVELVEKSPAIREHHFYVAIAKHVFMHVDKGVVFVRDSIRLKDAEKLGLKPLILYGIAVPGTQIGWQAFSFFDNPKSIASVLLDGWKNASGLRGCPDKLIVNRYVFDACPSLKSSLASIGDISLEVANGKDKRLSSSLRVAQYRVLELGWDHRGGCDIKDVNALTDYALSKHNKEMDERLWGLCGGDKEVKKRTNQWLDLPFNPPNTVLVDAKPDWTGGEWLSSWEAKVPSNQKTYFWRDDERLGCYWLLIGEEEVGGNDIADDDWNYCCAETAKKIIDCWPNTQSDVASAIGIKAKELNWFLNGQFVLPETKRGGLSDLIGIEARADWVSYDAIGPCVLIAKSPIRCGNAYEELSGGGDIDYSIEVLPDNGMPDPSWRYVVFAAHGRQANIMMFQRGSKASDQLGENLLINYQGYRIIPASIYRDVVSTCAKCCSGTVLNRKLSGEFNERNREYFEELGVVHYR